jgi:tripartite-type tricarboxylate transporter receptor subunit TctC
LATELFSHRAGVKMVHIPYKGLAPGTQAIVSGEAKVLLSTASSQLNGFIKEGRIKLLGVASPAPTPLVPGGVPIAQTLPGFNLEAWFGLLAPAGTPPDVVAKLNAAINAALKNPEVRARFESTGAQPIGSSPQQFRSRLTEEYATWSRVVREAKLSVD